VKIVEIRLFTFCALAVFVWSCDGSSSYQSSPARSTNYTAQDSIRMESLARQILTQPSQNDRIVMPHSNQTFENIQDVWDAAEDLESDANRLLSEAENANCNTAESSARSAISLAEDCKTIDNIDDARTYLDDAQSAFSEAESNFADCKNQSDE
jgi:hypothetical protein